MRSNVAPAGRTGRDIDAICSVTQVKDIVEQVRHASQEQSRGIEEVTRAITQMESVTQSTAASAEEGAAASEQLTAQAESSIDILAKLDGWRTKGRALQSNVDADADDDTPRRPRGGRRANIRPLLARPKPALAMARTTHIDDAADAAARF